MTKNRQTHSEWRDIPLEQYELVGSQLVHHSNRLRNSNASALGVRVDETQALRQPYVAVRTMIQHGDIPLDYVLDPKVSAPVLKQVDWIRANDERAAHLTAAERNDILAAFAAGSGQKAVIDRCGLSPRLAQLLLPTDSGEYLAVTPLSSGGLSALINEAVSQKNVEHQEDKDNRRFIRRAELQIGGANPQNVGRRAYAARRALFASGPSSNPVLKEAVALLRNGFGWQPATSVERALYTFNANERKYTGEERALWIRKLIASPIAASLIKSLSRRRSVIAEGRAAGIDHDWSTDVLAHHVAALGEPDHPLADKRWHNPIAADAVAKVAAVTLIGRNDQVITPRFAHSDTNYLTGVVTTLLQEGLPK